MQHCQQVVMLVTVAIIAVCLQGGLGQNPNIHNVLCRDQQEACVCNEDADVCQFQLKIEELQTFVSYRINDTDGELITRGTPGDAYFVGTSGYEASLPSSLCSRSRSDRPPECGRCWTDTTFTNEQTFKDMNCSVPMTVDGRSYRLYIAVNGRIPGPTLVVTENQIVQVDVDNRLTSEGVTIHWHGMHQQKTPWMDGVASLSQIPIVPGASFRYIFKATPAGTHWYHSHLGAQRTDGLFGGLIVRERSDVQEKASEAIGLGTFLDLPAEHTLTLLDWQRESSLNLFVQLHSTLGFYPNKQLGEVPNNEDQLYDPRTKSTDGSEVGPVPYWSGLINGRGRYDSNTYSILSIFNVTQGTSYRFRLIGAQSLYAYRFEIQGHKLTVVATDGFFIQPRTVDYIIIHSGERFDFLLNATQSPNNYLIRATTLETSIWTPETRNPRIHTAEAILHYEEATTPNPTNLYGSVLSNAQQDLRSCSESNRCVALNCPFRIFSNSNFTDCIVIDELRSLFPSDDSDLPNLNMISGKDRLKFFNFGFEGQSFTSAINGRNFLPPPSPYQVYRGQYDEDRDDESVNTCSTCNEMTTTDTQAEQCTCIHVEEIVTNENFGSDSDKSVMMVFSAVGDMDNRLRDFSHPVHLHGHSFYVVEVGHGTYDESSGTLMQNSDTVSCESTLCMKPTWRDNMAPDFSSYINITSDKLNNTAIRKDTVIVPAGGYVVIAFQADNPGYWFLHCHIEVHQLAGMALIIQEYDEAQHNYDGLPEGIVKVGNFNWTVDDYNEALKGSASMLWVPFQYTISLLLNVIVTKLILTQLL
jgi:FtsP/CotA-like multicopper oxidase with cupredoxin domain